MKSEGAQTEETFNELNSCIRELPVRLNRASKAIVFTFFSKQWETRQKNEEQKVTFFTSVT